MEAPTFDLRRFGPGDSLAELTELLHAAYRPLFEMGLEYLATRQDEEVTARRIENGECWVATRDGRLAATVTLYPPGCGRGHEVYARGHVAKIGQFGVRPEFQGEGLGSSLLDRVEARARELGATAIAGDTAEPARHLVAFYERRGYRVVGRANWDVVNYESLILLKPLAQPHTDTATRAHDDG